MKIKCCDCKKDMGEKDGNGQTGTSHTYCERCLVKFKKSLWEIKHIAKTPCAYYHPWATDDGRFIVFESESYRGGIIFSKYLECKTLREVEAWCDKLNNFF